MPQKPETRMTSTSPAEKTQYQKTFRHNQTSMRRLRDSVRPGISQRDDFILHPERSALLVVDIQTYLSDPHAVHGNNAGTRDTSYFLNESLPQVISNIDKLAQAFRLIRDCEDNPATSSGCEVIWTFLQSSTKDGRDISLDYKLSGMALANIPRVDVGFQELFLDNLRPDVSSGKGDILVPKTSCSVFQSTNLEYLLINLGIEQLVIVGQLTDQCIESAVRDAADKGFFVSVVEDASAAYSSEAHAKGLGSMKGFARILKTSRVIEEIQHGRSLELVVEPSGLVVSNETVLRYLEDRGLYSVAQHLREKLEQGISE